MLANLDPLQVWMLLYLPIAVIFYTIKHICKASAHWYRDGTTPTWCSGCDMLQPTASMRFTEIGLYRCGVCREPEKIITPRPTRLAEVLNHVKDDDDEQLKRWIEDREAKVQCYFDGTIEMKPVVRYRSGWQF